MEEQTLAVREALDAAVSLITTYGLSVVGGIVILILGWIAAGWLSGMTRRALGKAKGVDATLQGFFASLVKWSVIGFTIIAVLNQFGVETTSLIAVFGAAGLAIGLALQGTLGNLAAGVMLLIFRPFKLGHYVEVAGHAGTVKEITLFTTELATPDNVQIIIPNGDIWNTAITNYSHHPTRRVDFTLGIAYDDDIGQAMEIIRTVIAADPRCHTEPEAQIVVGELADSSVNLIVRVWTDAGDYWPLKFDLTRRFKEALDAGGISIPFPQTDVWLHREEAPAATGT